MIRWLLLVMIASALSCSSPTRPLADVIPATADGWTRSQVTPLPANDAPEMVRQLGLEQAVSATYTGPSKISVKIFRMKGQTSAFELIQRWRQSDGLAVYSGPFFLVADPASGPDAGGLLQALQKALK
jgi:hypothetical protein